MPHSFPCSFPVFYLLFWNTLYTCCFSYKLSFSLYPKRTAFPPVNGVILRFNEVRECYIHHHSGCQSLGLPKSPQAPFERGNWCLIIAFEYHLYPLPNVKATFTTHISSTNIPPLKEVRGIVTSQ